jgi:hypothetical protein
MVARPVATVTLRRCGAAAAPAAPAPWRPPKPRRCLEMVMLRRAARGPEPAAAGAGAAAAGPSAAVTLARLRVACMASGTALMTASTASTSSPILAARNASASVLAISRASCVCVGRAGGEGRSPHKQEGTQCVGARHLQKVGSVRF